MKKVNWEFEISKNFSDLTEETKMSTIGGKFSLWDLIPDWTDAIGFVLDLGTIEVYAPTVC